MMKLKVCACALSAFLVFGGIDLAGAVVIDFDSLTTGTPVTTQFPEATFSAPSGFEVKTLSIAAGLGTSVDNVILVFPFPFQEDLFIDFTVPVNNLTFLVGADTDTGTVAKVDVFESFALSGTVDIIGNGNTTDPSLVNLASFTNVTRIEINSVTDLGGLAYDDFSFAPVSAPIIPEPSTMLLLGSGLAGLVAWRMRKGQA